MMADAFETALGKVKVNEQKVYVFAGVETMAKVWVWVEECCRGGEGGWEYQEPNSAARRGLEDCLERCRLYSCSSGAMVTPLRSREQVQIVSEIVELVVNAAHRLRVHCS